MFLSGFVISISRVRLEFYRNSVVLLSDSW